MCVGTEEGIMYCYSYAFVKELLIALSCSANLLAALYCPLVSSVTY